MTKKLYLLFIIILLILIGKEVYNQQNKVKANPKAHRIECQKERITFEKVLKQDLVKQMQDIIKSGSFTLDVWADKAKYMKSVMFEKVSLDDIKNRLNSELLKYNIKNKKSSNRLLLDVMIYENDKKDPGKKTQKSKKYAGYIEVGCKLNNKIVYKIQTDFMSLSGADIPDRLECIAKSIMTLK
jgi:hypothetical protein